MKIAIITYDHPHKKTKDLVQRLIINGHRDISLICIPWQHRQPHRPIFDHRPKDPFPIAPLNLAFQLCLEYVYAFDLTADLLQEFDKILIGGCGIITEKITSRFSIINAHPGYLPNVRGLDAFKWAVLEQQPIGVTTHIIDAGIDQGILIDRTIITVNANDTFHSVAQRIYDTEIEMLARSITMPSTGISLKDEQYHPHGRMPALLEIKMKQKFDALCERSSSYC